jgi:hypothetical protein
MAHDETAWLALVGLGAFHGINPAMGWLFAVALGLHRKSRRILWMALVPIALGHALSVLMVVAALMLLGLVLDVDWLGRGAGIVLIGWAVWHWKYGHHYRVRVGMTTGLAGLALWSFLMATAHGAGLMLVPVILPLGLAASSAHEMTAHGMTGHGSIAVALAAVGVHTVAMLAVTGAVAGAVYEWFGLAFLRRGWINLDLVWVSALGLAGVILML